MTKAKVGDRIRIVEVEWHPLNEYYNGDEGEVTWTDDDGACVRFSDKGHNIYVFNEDFVVIENDADTSFPDQKEECSYSKDVSTSSAEAVRDNILRIREKRNDLKMEITALDKEEADCVEKLKQQGFVLYEQNEPETLATEKKTILYAEDIEADMNDPKNWKVGDIIECIDSDIAPIGSLATITEINGDTLYRSGGEGFISGCFNVETKNIWKFHSRPL